MNSQQKGGLRFRNIANKQLGSSATTHTSDLSNQHLQGVQRNAMKIQSNKE